MSESIISRLEDDTTSMCGMVIRELSNCIKYNDTERVNYFTYPAKLKLDNFDITQCSQWSQLSNDVKKVNQSFEIINKIGYPTVVGILLHGNKDVELKYLL